MKYEFFMNINPPTVTHQEKRVAIKNGKPVFFEDTNLKNARMLFMAQLSRFRPAEPMKGAVELLTKWCYIGKVIEPKYKTTKPDTDNMIKLLKDCMTRSSFWADDAQIACEITEKFVVPERPGIYVRVKELEREANQ